MILREGNIWSAWDDCDLFLITVCNVLNQGGALTMGKGIALQAVERFPGIDRALGAAVRAAGVPDFGLIVSPRWPDAKLGIFQSKYDWSAPSPIDLIRHSAMKLRAWCEEHPTARVTLNMPGVGEGKLAFEQVYQLLSGILPETVSIWCHHQPVTLIAGSRAAKPELCQQAAHRARLAAAEGHRIIVGDAKGVDTAVVDACEAWGLPYTCYGKTTKGRLPQATCYRRMPDTSTYTERDAEMVALADRVYVYWNGESGGSAKVYDAALLLKKAVWLNDLASADVSKAIRELEKIKEMKANG